MNDLYSTKPAFMRYPEERSSNDLQNQASDNGKCSNARTFSATDYTDFHGLVFIWIKGLTLNVGREGKIRWHGIVMVSEPACRSSKSIGRSNHDSYQKQPTISIVIRQASLMDRFRDRPLIITLPGIDSD